MRTSIWGRALDPKELSRLESEMLERAVGTGGYVCRRAMVGEGSLLKSEPGTSRGSRASE